MYPLHVPAALPEVAGPAQGSSAEGRPPVLGVIGDVHTHFRHLDQVVERLAAARDAGTLDGVLLVGDLACAGRGRQRDPARIARWRKGAREVLERVAELDLPMAWVPGNHDMPDGEVHGYTDRNADRRRLGVGGLTVHGIGGAGPARFGFAYEWDESEIRSRELMRADVLLCHCPPARTPLDRVNDGRQVGSEAIRERAITWPGVMACGHIHEAPGVFALGVCLCVNAGALGAPYGRPQVGFVVGRDAVVHEDLPTGRRLVLHRRPAIAVEV